MQEEIKVKIEVDGEPVFLNAIVDGFLGKDGIRYGHPDNWTPDDPEDLQVIWDKPSGELMDALCELMDEKEFIKWESILKEDAVEEAKRQYTASRNSWYEDTLDE